MNITSSALNSKIGMNELIKQQFTHGRGFKILTFFHYVTSLAKIGKFNNVTISY